MIYTIGHSNHSRQEFFKLLSQHGITALADVRSVPYSRRHPDYNREVLKDWLKREGIAYVFLGDCLGGRSRDPADFIGDRVDYERVRRKQSFQHGIERLQRGMAQYKIALMCAEKDPLTCHRGLLIAPKLEQLGIAVGHILADGGLERHCLQTEDRLLAAAGYEADLFASRAEFLALAYRGQAGTVAYRRKIDG